MVRRLTEDEWRLVVAFSMVYGKGSLQFKLLTMLRSMDDYNSIAEKKAFADNHLTSMRSTAKKWLIRTVRRLALYQSEAYEQVLDLDVLMLWGEHDEYTVEAISEAKQLATDQEEYSMLTSLYRNELQFVKDYFQGDERTSQIIRVCDEAKENARLVQLGFEIERHSAFYLETARTRLLAAGKFDDTYTETYFRSKFYLQNIDEWPISYQIQKLRIDEGLHYFLGRTAEAAETAEQLLELIVRLETIRKRQSEDHARCLFRLSAYYSDLDRKEKVIWTIDEVRSRSTSGSQLRLSYLRRLAFTLLGTAFQFGMQDLASEGLQIWSENKTILEGNPKDVMQFETLLRVFAQYLSMRIREKAREAFNFADEISNSIPYFTHLAVLKILHLMLLLEEDDERGLQSFGKNYKRHVAAYLKKDPKSNVAKSALELMMILCKASNLEGKPKFRKSLALLLVRLNELLNSKDANFSPYLYPMIKWAETRIHN